MARTKLQQYFLATGVVFLALFVSLVYRAIHAGDILIVNAGNTGYLWYPACVLWTAVTGTSLVVASICLHISCVKASKSHTVKSILIGYIINQCTRYGSIFARRKLDAYTKQPRRTQENLLAERMNRDADTQYGKRHNFKNIKTLKDLQRQHPITEYEHYAEYVQKMADGEENVLIREPLVRFGITSGTTGKGKLIPLTKSKERTSMLIMMASQGAASKTHGWSSPIQKEIYLYVNPKPSKTPSGHLVGPLYLFDEDAAPFISAISNSVWESFSITTEFEATYLTLLFGLRDKNIAKLMGPFSSMVHKAMTLLEKNWERIVNDISLGRIDDALEITPEVRNACLQKLSPDPERGQELREEFEKGFDGIMRRVWPSMSYIIGIETSDFTERLNNGYARGIPIFSLMYSSTEGDYGCNLWPAEDNKYTLVPQSVIYEFIPESNMSEDKPATLLIDEVQKGQRYEMVVSTPCGFYRYKFGDVIEVVDFYNQTPVVKFLYRSGQLLNLRAEKVTELSVSEAVYRVASNWPQSRVLHWTSAESTILSKIPDPKAEFEPGLQFYLIFVELEGDVDTSILDEKLQQQFDDVLRDANNYYRGYRNAGTISPPRVYLVQTGAFKSLQDHIIANTSASYNQFKLPRKLKTADTLKFMLNTRS